MSGISNRIKLKKYPPFVGGYEFKNFTHNTPKSVIETPTPAITKLRLRQGFGDEVPLTVKIGDEVNAGQIIARDDNAVCTPILSSVSGRIIKKSQLTQSNKTINVVEIETKDTSRYLPVQRPDKDPLTYSHEEIGEILYLAGVTALGKSGLPTQYRSSVIKREEVKEVIVNTLHTRPFSFPSKLIIKKYGEELINGLQILKRLYPQARINLTVDKKDSIRINKLLKTKQFQEEVTIHLLSNKYPQEHQQVLLKTLFNLDIPEGQAAIDLGVVILESHDLIPISQAVMAGKPLLDRLVFVSGSGCEQRDLVYKVKVGTPATAFVKTCAGMDVRIVSSSVLNGRIWDTLDWPTTRYTSSLAILSEGNQREFLSFMWPGHDRDSYSKTYLSALLPFFKKKSDTNINGECRACIYCNYCEEVCPAQIIPHHLFRLIEKDMVEEIIRFKITDCINCGLCTYVCPSKIELAAEIKEAQQKVYGE